MMGEAVKFFGNIVFYVQDSASILSGELVLNVCKNECHRHAQYAMSNF